MKNKIYTYIAFFIVCSFGFAQSTNQNYVKETIYNNENNVSNPSSPKNVVTITYLDGLGRPIQIVNQNSSPDNNKNIVTHIEYEKNIGKIKDYLPFVSSSNSSDFDNDAKNNTLDFHNNRYLYEYLGEKNPYSEIRLEKNPNARVLETAAPGKVWKMGNGHTIKTEYHFNNIEEVKKFNVNTNWNQTNEVFTNSISLNGFYPKNSLHKTIVKNENWTSGTNNTIEEFKGVDGKIILKRAYNDNVRHDTYYVYDFHGNLAYVIPPLADGVITGTNLDDLCYQYVYDKKNRLVEKKLPQKNWEYIVYDKADRIVLTGPVYSPFANNTKGWIFSKYDQLSRVVYTGYYNANTFTSLERKNIQNTVNNQTALNESKLASNATLDGITIKYSNSVFPTTATHLLNINYYDDYKYPNAPTSFPTIEGQATIENNVKGLQTGNWIRVITTPSERKGDLSYTLYNSKYQPLRTYSKNHLDGYIQTDHHLNFIGTVNKTTSKYKKSNSDSELTIVNSFTYDNQQRLLVHKQKIGNQPEEVITSNVYEELGELQTKNVGGVVNATEALQKVDYNYNVRGWLSGINSFDLEHSDANDLFNYMINYDDDGYRIGSERQYNGGIASILWSTKQDNILRGYTFDYDHLNRLTNAETLKSWPRNPGLYRTTAHRETISYDKNGNIITLKRNGEDLNNQENKIDDLTYFYNANQLLSVIDTTNSSEGFNDGNSIGNDYTYDGFGNLIADKNKKISQIKYNHLNLPTEIVFETGKILYTYDAAGSKVKKVVQPTSGLAQTTEYVNGFQYLNNQLQFFPHPEGYVKPKTSGGFLYVYQYKDHLGNVRLSYADLDGDGVINPATEILEEKNYYPFGLQHKGYNEVVKPERSIEAEQIGYNGKEFEDSFDLNMNEMDLRQYDPAIARWVAQDPVIHHEFSPYSAFDNNPVYWADPSGADAVSNGGNSIDIEGLFNTSKDGDSYDFKNGSATKKTSRTEAEMQKFYEMAKSYLNGSDGGGNGNGGGGWGKNKNANSKGVGYNPSQAGFFGMTGITFFGAPIRLIPYDFGASSYFGGAINVYVGTWNEYLKKGLDSYIGRHLKHEYGHYLQEKYTGTLNYYSEVVPASLESFQGKHHDRNWTEIQASTLAWIYFNNPKKFDNENIIQYNSISPYAPAPIPYEVIKSLQNQYINHPDYKP